MNEQLAVAQVRPHEIDSSLQVRKRQQVDPNGLRLWIGGKDACVNPGSNRRLRDAEEQRRVGDLGTPFPSGEVSAHPIEPLAFPVVYVAREVFELEQVVHDLRDGHGITVAQVPFGFR
jgi:hypothetical protein